MRVKVGDLNLVMDVERLITAGIKMNDVQGHSINDTGERSSIKYDATKILTLKKE